MGHVCLVGENSSLSIGAIFIPWRQDKNDPKIEMDMFEHNSRHFLSNDVDRVLAEGLPFLTSGGHWPVLPPKC